MLLDAGKLEDGATLETDICIVGCGPAGITLAREFLGGKEHVLVLESGGKRREGRAQELNAGGTVGDPYGGLGETRHRQVGGAANIWNTPVRGGIGAKYAPLDPWDFLERPGVPHSGWPFGYSHLEPFYRRAQEVCGLGPFSYREEGWTTPERPGLSLTPELEAGIYQFGPRNLFTRTYIHDLRGSSNVRLYHHATICGFDREGGSRRFRAARGVSVPGKRFQVRARVFVLAAGAVENARLLLLSADGRPGGPGNEHGWVGRCFMEHPRDYALTLNPYSPRLFSEASFYDPHEALDGTVIGGRIGLGERAVAGEGLPNASLTLLPRVKEQSSIAGWATRLWLCPHSSGRRGLGGGYGWSRMKNPSRWLDGFRLIVNTEQRPNPENRVVLSRKLDSLGVPQAELHWRWREEEEADLERLRTALASWIERSGLGRVEVEKDLKPDPNACHHAGTTRMHEDPRKGVVNSDGLVHGMDNLYVTGGSVFPTVGYANPTLTIVALALRLADHLRHRNPESDQAEEPR